jgi:hypothetical protein
VNVLSAWTPANRAALAALAASVVLCALAASGARRLAALPEEGEPRQAAAMPEVTARASAASDARILSAVARDPFRPDRRRPPGRYRLPGQEPPPEVPPERYDYTPPPAAPSFGLLGTVVLPGGRGLAALAGRGGESRIVRVGEEMDGFRVVRVTSGAATLTDGDTTIVLTTQGGAP